MCQCNMDSQYMMIDVVRESVPVLLGKLSVMGLNDVSVVHGEDGHASTVFVYSIYPYEVQSFTGLCVGITYVRHGHEAESRLDLSYV